MAGDWIKMRTDLAEDPAVIAMAAELDVEEDLIVGKLHRLWSWADQQSRDGHAVGVTQKWIDRKVGLDGFALAMSNARWLELDARGITLPNFDRHNGESAKNRALGTRRKQKQRHGDVPDLSRSHRDKSVTREEKRREEARATSPIPPSGASPGSEQPNPRRARAGQTFADFVHACRDSGEKPIPADDAVFAFADAAGIPRDYLALAWREFSRDYRPKDKRQKDWRAHFRNAVRRNWYKLWWFPAEGQCDLTTGGVGVKRELDAEHKDAA